MYQMETDILKDDFQIYKQKNSSCNVKLTNLFLTYSLSNIIDKNRTNCESLCIKDIIGCACMRSTVNIDGSAAFITIYAYLMRGNSPNKRRKRKIVTFEISKYNAYKENLEVAKLWKSAIYSAIYSSFEEKGSKASPIVEVGIYSSKKNLLVLINPRSGPGLAYEIYKKSMKPILTEADIPHEVIVTTHSNHAYKLIQHKDLSIYSGIVIVSGDGLLYEVYNGLLQRNDSEVALSIPIGVIPGGSGNGLARSISYNAKEPYLSNPVLVSSLNIVNPIASPMDLVLINTLKGNNLISFLSIGYGIMSDIDIESERLRIIGEARFTVYGFANLLNLKKHRVRLSYKLADIDPVTNKKSSPVVNNNGKLSHSKSFEAEKKRPSNSEAEKKRPSNFEAEKKRPSNSEAEKKRPSNSEAEKKRPSNSEEEKTFQQPTKQRQNSVTSEKRDTDEDNISIIELASEATLYHADVEASSSTGNESVLPRRPTSTAFTNNLITNIERRTEGVFDHPVPDDWITIEDDFISIYAVCQPFIGSSLCMSPNSTKDDGVMWLCYVKGSISKISALRFLLGVDNGTHINLPEVTYVPVTALRLDPLKAKSRITIDGELVDNEPIHATVLPGRGRIMIRRP